MENRKTKYPLAIWYNLEESINYGFPVGAKDPWGGEVVPLLNSRIWEYRGTWPAGLLASNIRADNGNKVRCDFAGEEIFTASWAFEQ